MTRAADGAPTRAPDSHTRFVRETFAAADRAEHAAEPWAADLDLAGARVALRGAGGALGKRLLPAVAHRQVPPDDCAAGLTVRLVDSASTGVRLPPAPWAWPRHLPRGQVPGFASGPIRAAYEPSWGGLILLDLERDLAVVWAQDARVIATWELAAPLRTALHWWLPGRGRRLVHGAGLGTAASGVLLVGPGGSGKSTTALAGLLGGLRYLGDDYVAVGPDDDWTVFNLYRTGKVVPDNLAARLPGLSGAPRLVRDRDKDVLLLDTQQDVIPDRLPLSMVVVPAVTGGRTRLRSLGAGAALRALAPSTIFQQPGDDDQAFGFMARLVREVPCRRLELGDDPGRVAAVLREAVAT